MTAKSFEQKIKSIYRLDNIVNYVTSFILLGIGLYFFFIILTEGFPKKNGTEKYILLVVPFIPIVIGSYAIWRIPQDYTVYQIDSSLSIEEKIKLIEKYFSNVKVIWKSVEDNYRSYRYRNRWWGFVDLRFYVNDTNLLFNAHGADRFGMKGIFDFGLTWRSRQRLKKFLKAKL